jgi:hypothetical protein
MTGLGALSHSPSGAGSIRQGRSESAIDLSAMIHCDRDNEQNAVLDRVDDPTLDHSDAISVSSCQWS